MNSEEQLLIFNSILISTPSIVYTYDVENSRIHFLNDGIYDQLGFPKSEIKTMHLDEFLGKMPSSDQHRYKSHIEAVLLGREKKFTAFDYRLQKRNGDWKWFSDTIFQLKTETPANKTLVGYATDISNIRKKEERYQWEEIRLKAILENTREYYIFLNTEFIIQSLNKNAQDFLFNAYRRSIFEGYSILEFLPLETTSVFTEKFNYALNGVPIHYESQFIDEKKEVKWYQFSYIPVRDKKDRITNVCFIFVDMTEIRRTNQSLVELNRSLEFRVSERTKELEAEVAHRIDTENRLRVALEKEKELNELKSKFIALVSHEFKTPMTTILMSTQMLEEYRDIHTVGDREKHYNRIKEATLSLNRLMEGVLSISRSESSLIDFKPALINVRKFLSGLITNFESNHPANKFELFIPPNDEIFFNLDSNLLTHILENLLSNAVKYSSNRDAIFLEVLFLDEQIEFIVKNKGEGIPEEDRDHIFETFYRGKNVENISGTGLGLSVVKNFVALHKGTVSFKSSPEEGTEFHIRIPTI
ncbi:MAG TPA: ATP-binding protein [Leptospiraceae bacterium]|nr:PAS domain S-box protein [Leptospiraceae bacterium]HRG73151.1 ATP-binding protein [Leptospiraceae bacterium]